MNTVNFVSLLNPSNSVMASLVIYGIDNDTKIIALNSHDGHVIIQSLLAPEIHPFMNKEIRSIIIELYIFSVDMCLNF